MDGWVDGGNRTSRKKRMVGRLMMMEKEMVGYMQELMDDRKKGKD